MEFLLDLDLDWLCLAAEFAAGLLLLSIAWRPVRESSTPSEPSATTIDWEPVQAAFLHAVTSVGRCISLRFNRMDEDRLKCLQQELPLPLRDRLTGTWNSHGMDRLHEAWCNEPDLHGYPSCYVAITLADQDALMEQHGATCVEQTLRRISELLVSAFSGQASLSRYQPNRFLLHFYGSSVSECHAFITPILEQINAPEFFSAHGEAISIRCISNYWLCNRGIGTEELLQLLDDGGDSVSDAPGIPTQVSESKADADVAESERELEAVPEKPFSIDSLASFPSPWDDPPEETPPSAPSPSSSLQSGAENASTNIDPDASIEPVLESGSEVSTNDATDSVEGFASPEDIANLIAQLQPKTSSSVSPVATTSSELPSMDLPPEAKGPDSVMVDPVVPEMPSMVPESPKTRSIYTDDIEDTVLKSDLASLFATVRSSAAGDFGYEMAPNTGASHDPGAGRQ